MSGCQEDIKADIQRTQGHKHGRPKVKNEDVKTDSSRRYNALALDTHDAFLKIPQDCSS